MVADRRAAIRLWLVVFGLVTLAGQIAVGMRASTTSEITGDEPFYLLTTRSLTSDGDLDLRDEYRNREYREFWRAEVPLWRQMEPLPDGRLVSPHEPGLSVLLVPAYEIGGLRGAQRFLVLLWAAAMACAALVSRRLGAPVWAAGLGACLAGAGAPGIVYASQIYPEGAAALAVAAGLLVATSARVRPVAAALVLAALPWLGTRYVAFAALFGVAFSVRLWHDRRALALMAALAGAAAIFFAWWHLRTFDGLTPYGANAVYAGEGTGDIVGHNLAWDGRSYRLYGLFLDERFGLLRWLPAVALAAFGVVRRTVLPATVFATGVLVGTFASITMMGWWFPGRMLVAGFPGLAVLLAFAAGRLPRAALVLGGWSVAIAASVAWSAHTGGVRLAVDPFDLGAPLPPASLFPDFRRFGLGEVALSIVWGALAGALLALTARRRSRSARVRAATLRTIPVRTG